MEQPSTDNEKKVIDKTSQKEEPGSFLASIGITELRTKMLIVVIFLFVFFSATVSFSLMPPANFPDHKIITIKSGDSLRAVSDTLHKENIIRSRYYFEVCSKIVGGKRPVMAGEYLFEKPISACRIAIRIARGFSGIPEAKVTFPEGVTNKQITEIIKKDFPDFDTASFLRIAKLDEGFLFPDTYLFRENVTPERVVSVMKENFKKRIGPLGDEIKSTGHSTQEIIIMASILEKEATSDEDKALVSGILWKRISIGMPLQVDASFLYLLGKKSSEVTVEDLQIKSTYNTYANKGLPSGPIGNPGINAIKAAIYPVSSEYLYYLSDNSGTMHYAKTFEGHKANKVKYLK